MSEEDFATEVSARPFSEWVVIGLLVAVGVRILSSVIGGFAHLAVSVDFLQGQHRAGDVILNFAAFGSALDGLLLLAIAAVLWWPLQNRRPSWRTRQLALASLVAAVATGMAALVSIIGLVLFTSDEVQQWRQISGEVGLHVSDAVLAFVAAAALQRLVWLVDGGIATTGEPSPTAE